jgi:molecular chaperone DnaK
MKRMTIDFGIDLGTTNSTIAVVDGVDAKPIPNKVGSIITPSAVWIDKRGNLHVGEEAKGHALKDDPENGDLEFKLRMGMREEGIKRFVRSERAMLPEELSAEVLKSLKMDVQTNMGEDVQAAVITVPAAFELPQTAATKRAACGTTDEEAHAGIARIAGAGIKHCILLQEPVAASLAYGFQSMSENVYWLVFDFGGGTFDAALMRVRDGLIQVVNNDGDNHLGGKLIDWDITTRILIPALRSKYRLTDLSRGNPRWTRVVGALKYAAEKAKIEVCRTRMPHEIYIENLCQDEDGKDVDFLYSLTPDDIIETGMPYVERALNLCKKVLKDKGLSGQDLSKVLMVGGSTLNPWLRETVERDLGAPLEYGIDPVAVVARGAAIFAGTQKMPDLGLETDRPLDVWTIEVEHEPVGNVPDPDIGGRVKPPAGASPKGCTVEFVDERTRWRSGRLTLGAEGVFITQLFADDKRRCEYAIELCDPTGTRLPVEPDRVAYTIGLIPDRPSLSNTIGIGLANEQLLPYVEKGARLPAHGSNDHRTVMAIRAGNPEDKLTIPILEGENKRAVRNHLIGVLEISGADIRRDLPSGSQVEVRVAIDESQQIRAQAYLPVLDEDFQVRISLQMTHESLPELRRQMQEQAERLKTLREKLGPNPGLKAASALSRVDEEQLIRQVEELAEAASQDTDALQQLDRRVRDLSSVVDHIEDAAEWPDLLQNAEKEKVDTNGFVQDHGDAQTKEVFQALQKEHAAAISSGDPMLLRRVAEHYLILRVKILEGMPAFHAARFDHLAGRLQSMRDIAQAEQIVAQGRRAINNDDVNGLKLANAQLSALLPEAERESVDKRVGGVI